jgi:hypothetical protein
LDPTSHYSSTTVLIARLLFAERNTNTKASTMNNSITQQECRPVSDEELNTISGGMMETVFWSEYAHRVHRVLTGCCSRT